MTRRCRNTWLRWVSDETHSCVTAHLQNIKLIPPPEVDHVYKKDREDMMINSGFIFQMFVLWRHLLLVMSIKRSKVPLRLLVFIIRIKLKCFYTYNDDDFYLCNLNLLNNSWADSHRVRETGDDHFIGLSRTFRDKNWTNDWNTYVCDNSLTCTLWNKAQSK